MKLQGWLISFSTRREGQAGDYLHFSACGSVENKKHEPVLKRSQEAEGVMGLYYHSCFSAYRLWDGNRGL